jgi:hypothetical protein
MATWSRSRWNHDQHRPAAWQWPVTLRLADEDDVAGLERLAALDSCLLPPGPHLVAERDRRIEAASSLATGQLVADPFRRTAELCELLRCHAGGVRVAAKGLPATPLRARPRLWTRGCSEALAEEQPV